MLADLPAFQQETCELKIRLCMCSRNNPSVVGRLRLGVVVMRAGRLHNMGVHRTSLSEVN